MIVSLIANTLALSALLVMLASGLALIYGLRNVMNFGHGAIYMLGAYLSYTVATYLNFWAALIAVPLAMAVFGIAFEYLIVRPFHRRPHMDVAMITYGLSLALGQVILWIYGGEPRAISAPDILSGSVNLFGTRYPSYRMFTIAIGLLTFAALAGWLKWTRSGLYVRAVSQQPVVAEMMGVNSDRLSLIVVSLSTAFAGLAGVLAGPYISVDPDMGPSSIVTCLIIVVVGGVGSIVGAICVAVVFGFIQVVGAVFVPAVSSLVPYALLIVILLWRPQGLLGRVS